MWAYDENDEETWTQEEVMATISDPTRVGWRDSLVVRFFKPYYQ